MDPEALKALISQALTEHKTQVETVSKAEVEEIVSKAITETRAQVEAEMQKSLLLNRGESAGRTNVQTLGQATNPVEELLQKAQKILEGEDLKFTDKDSKILNFMTFSALSEGL